MSELDADFARAAAALAAAAAVLQRHARPGLPFEMKPGHGPVTAADREADALLRELLPRPGDGWLSEESDDDPSRLGRSRVWVVDPLDGTRAFLAGRPEYAVSIALLVDGEPVLGAVGNPALGTAVLGGPGRPLVVTGPPAVAAVAAGATAGAPALACLAVNRSEWRRGEWAKVADRCRLAPCNSVAWNLALVAAGAACATWTLQPKHEWDVAAGAALVRAAGGEVWLPRGGHLLWNRRRPRFLSFAAAAPGRRGLAEALLGACR